MNKTQRRLLFFMLVIALVAIPTIAVLAKELGSLSITGPGIKGELTLNDHDEMMKLEGSGFFELMKASPPKNLGDGYNITAYLNLDGKIVPFVQMVYYPTEEGKPGYVHYIGRLNGESLQTVDEWGMLLQDADNTLRGLMTAHSVVIQSALVAAPSVAQPEAAKPSVAVPATGPSVSPMPIQPLYVAGIAAILVLVGAGLVLRRRSVNQRSS
jgi:hypothetical protein